MLQVPEIEEMLVNMDLGQKIHQLSVTHQFCNVRGGKRSGTKQANVIKVLDQNIVNIVRKTKLL